MNTALTLLVVDDNLPICEYLSEILKAAGFTVLCALDGTEAIALLDSHAIDLAIIDLLLPGAVSGDDVADHAASRRVKVITMSGALSSDRRGRHPRHIHLEKPFRGPALFPAIKEVLG